jgi:hypothetical protein
MDLRPTENSFGKNTVMCLLSQPLLTPKCHVSGVQWRTITGSGLDDWIYWHFSYNYNQL